MEIRLSTNDDIDFLMDITRRCIQNLDKQQIYQWDQVYPSQKDFHEDITAQNLYVISSGSNNLSGCICINELELPGYERAEWAGSQFFVIHKLIIDPLYENRGYGKKAMEFAETLAHSHGKDSLRLDCFKLNLRANRFYTGLGYTIKGETRFRMGSFHLYEKII